ncbi:MAG: glycogen/starch/alpha-glucan phosphorylase [Oscillospiraceae bacterium]|nr:glycogen/starch/alpha-glucan phosphorylase [Oscillospiraceae bacterium]
MELFALSEFQKKVSDLSTKELHIAVSKAVMAEIAKPWERSKIRDNKKRRAYYFSAEFLMGRAIYNNLLCAGLLDEAKEVLETLGADISQFEEIEDAALGNGGLGRLAACFLDSAATLGLALDGYGIRYRFGLFRQSFKNGFQKESLDDWGAESDPWSVRCETESVLVRFSDGDVRAVPYDMAIIGYGAKHINTLRLWQAEPLNQFDFEMFNDQKYDQSVRQKNRAEDISRVLYPNDSTFSGKLLRLKQQYFFSSASLQDILRKFKTAHGSDFERLADFVTIQLNDTHPVISIPELVRLLMNEGVEFDRALEICKKVFNYTNHTVMPEALEKWDMALVKRVSKEVAHIIVRIDKTMRAELRQKKVAPDKLSQLLIVQDGRVNMAYLACAVSAHINGVAAIHTEILKDNVLNAFYSLYPKKFQNKTNGITQRRWLKLCNAGLSNLVTRLIGSEDWVCNLDRLKELERYADDKAVLDEFAAVRLENKKRLCEFILKKEGREISPDFILDAQIKRLHEYKRQLLNALAILELYFEIKEGSLPDFAPTTFLFGAKAAPGYFRAKAVIKLINEIAKLIENDEQVRDKIKVIFISDYNVSYAEKIIAAADVSEQISTAGTEASGTGNMKLMLGGAVTIGTYDGANIEIFEAAGEENNFRFGAKTEDIELLDESYDSEELYKSDARIRRCLDALIDGTLSDDGSGMFEELYTALLKGASWHKADHYYLLYDFDSYLKAKIEANRCYQDRYAFLKKGWLNMCNAGRFSSDRTIKEYAKEIWKIK